MIRLNPVILQGSIEAFHFYGSFHLSDLVSALRTELRQSTLVQHKPVTVQSMHYWFLRHPTIKLPLLWWSGILYSFSLIMEWNVAEVTAAIQRGLLELTLALKKQNKIYSVSFVSPSLRGGHSFICVFVLPNIQGSKHLVLEKSNTTACYLSTGIDDLKEA